jgi:predicted nucleic acid-binding protein
LRAFVDTNLWVYRLDRREPEKSIFMRDWIRKLATEHEIVVSTQVMIELRSVLTRKFTPPLSPSDTRIALEVLSAFEVVGTHSSLVLDAHELATRERLSWFDALILESAIRSGCDVLFSEDFDHQRRFGTLTVLNPLLG